MPLKQADKKLTEAEYLQAELVSEMKNEYVDGHIYAMNGASVNHNRLVGNIFRLLPG